MTQPPEGPRVSVIVPVYNAGARLTACLDSLFGQDIASEDVEVIAIDDGSTDGSGAVLDAYAARHPGMRVIHQANSGWPGRPRNVGTDAARGEYVFYLDADDTLAPDALRRMVEHAGEHGSDIVVVRSVPIRDGRPRRPAAMRHTVGDFDVELAFRQLTPHKLVRRAFLQETGLRFAEGRVRLEDGIFFARAYLLARRISALGDADYYRRHVRVEGGNVSRELIDPHEYAQSLATIFDTIRELDGDRERADRVIRRQYRQKALKFLAPRRFLDDPPQRRGAVVDAMGASRAPTSRPSSRLASGSRSGRVRPPCAPGTSGRWPKPPAGSSPRSVRRRRASPPACARCSAARGGAHGAARSAGAGEGRARAPRRSDRVAGSARRSCTC